MTKTKHSGHEPADENQEKDRQSEAGEGANYADLFKEVSELRQELGQAKTSAQENLDGWQRERADFANYKRRIERDNQTLAQTISGNLIRKYLDIQDDMDRAIAMRDQEGDLAAWAAGIDLIHRKLKNVLDQEGVKLIPAEGQEFDPNLHEAITYEDSPDHASGEVIGVIQQGYTIGDRVIRPARVRVAR